jgi:alpha-beta hydrolase superfamily lysophospholipase
MKIAHPILLNLCIIFCAAKPLITYSDIHITCVTPEITNSSIVYLFSHGLDPRKNTGIRQAKEYISNGIIQSLCYTFNYDDSPFSVNFGQEDDYNRLLHAYNYICDLYPTAQIVLAGLSRGSVAILHFLALQQAEKLAPIKAIILESPFDTIDTIIEHVAQQYCWFIPESNMLLKKLVSAFKNYKTYGLQPIMYARQITLDIPFLITYSLQDKVVPAYATQNIINTLIKNNNNVTVVELEQGKHSTLSYNNRLQNAAHTFLNSKN